MRILLDTNILISAYVFGGAVRSLVRELLRNGDELCVSEYIIQEFDAKLDEKWPEKAPVLKPLIHNSGFSILKSTDRIVQSIRDVKDNAIVADALDNSVDVILTQDKDFLESSLTSPRIISVSEMWEYIKGLP